MNRVEELIERLCPDGVEYKKLGDVCSIKGRVGWQGLTRKEYRDSGDYYLVTGTDFTSLHTIDFNNCVYVEKERFEQDEKIQLKKDDILITKDGTLGKLAIIDYLPKPATLNGGIFVIRSLSTALSQKFILHYMLSNKFKKMISSYHTGSTIQHLTQNILVNFQIPIPPLEVQNEIVKILDNFTQLEAELEAELEARKKQYEYYLDYLCDFSQRSDIPFVKIGELYEFKNGLNKGKEYFGTGMPIINFTDVYNNRWLTNNMIYGLVDVTDKEIQSFSAKKGDIFFTRTSETQEDIGHACALLDDVPSCVFSGFVLRARPKTKLLHPKFAAYYLSTHNSRKEIVRYSTYTTRALTSGPRLSKLIIAVPPLEEQARIVSILDRFDQLCNDLTEGLPAEIEARKKQYEYYREKLLTFKKKETELP